ncbi:MAG: shikimate kinase [Halanaerobiales bacterium]
MIISLIGFMGTGKTTVGKKLARRLDFNFFDTDQIIEDKTGLNIKKLFKIHGEDYFRSLETEVLRQICTNKSNIVLSTGGGIILKKVNRRILLKYTHPVLLKASVEEILERVDIQKRPLLCCKNPCKKVELLLDEREELYEIFSPKINTDNKNQEALVEEIIKKIQRC